MVTNGHVLSGCGVLLLLRFLIKSSDLGWPTSGLGTLGCSFSSTLSFMFLPLGTTFPSNSEFSLNLILATRLYERSNMTRDYSQPKLTAPPTISILKFCIHLFDNCNHNSTYLHMLFTNDLDMHGRGFYLIRDNDSKHTSGLCMRALEKHKISWKRTPANSADINVIEMIWADLKRYVRKKRCTSIAEMELAIREFEASLTQIKCKRYIVHLNEVLKVIVSRKCDWNNN
ncbi:Transposable element Tcb1 transposase [Brachionus plicatilis]|uniref:Transposable element Tcb1 transposase n=1 Tax=Brachionus plicatilis TaxID=10195 RepID=A0A3M7P8U4_BRAPC|nr:Transposable element Tcb1 transposase [Brachionus plicatilis]